MQAWKFIFSTCWLTLVFLAGSRVSGWLPSRCPRAALWVAPGLAPHAGMCFALHPARKTLRGGKLHPHLPPQVLSQRKSQSLLLSHEMTAFQNGLMQTKTNSLGPSSLRSLSLRVEEIRWASVVVCVSGSKAGIACPPQFDGAPHHFQIRIWQKHVRPRHPQHVPATLEGSSGLGAGCGHAGTRCHQLRWGRLGGRGVPIPSPAGGRASRTCLLPGGEEKAAPRLHTPAFYFHGRLEARQGPRDADINSQIPGAAPAGDLSELIFPLFSSVES